MKNKLLIKGLSLLLICLCLCGCAGQVTEPPSAQQSATVAAPIQTLPQETLPDGGVTRPVHTDPSIPEILPVETQPQEEDDDRPRPTPPEQEEQPLQPTQPPSSLPGGFTVYFIDVGQADAALVICDGRAMLIDGGNAADSNLMYAFLKKKGVTHLDYIVGTHAHEDHIGGLSGALNYATVGTVYCPVTSYSSNAFSNFAKNVEKQGKSITVPSRGTQFSLGSAQCTILAVNTTSDTNNSSIVLRIVYGSTSFLFTGDGERDVEQALINRGADLSSTVLKVGHHGSYTSTSYAFLWNVMPQYAIISCGQDNSYGHPHDEVLSRLRDARVTLFRTDMQGDIVCTSNGSSVSFTVSRNRNANVYGELGGSTQYPEVSQPENTEPEHTEPEDTEPEGTAYVLNTNSMKFHYPNCEWAEKISDRNRQDYVGSREDLLEMGYDPCGGCNP